MSHPSLDDGIRQAGSAVNLLWKPGAAPSSVPVVPPQFNGWRKEQRAWEETAALFNLCHHMFDTTVKGPDALRLLSYCSANNYDNFSIGQAKQFVAVGHDGNLIQDGIVLRFAEDHFALAGIQTIHDWVAYQAQEGAFDVELTRDPPSDFRDGPPPLFRFQVQGPRAMNILGDLFGDQLDDIKFFHFREVSLAGHKMFALRHGMAGQSGFELFGDGKLAEIVHETLISAGEKYGMEQVGGLAYYSSSVDSGWLATPVPAIYSQAEMAGFRQYVGLFSYEGQMPLHGSFYSPDIADYYCTPFEIGYGRSISFGHDFIGREALMAARDNVRRKKVTLVWNPDDVKRIFGADHDFILSYAKDRVEKDGRLVGLSQYITYVDTTGTVHSLALVESALAVPGTELTVVWGEHPGAQATGEVKSGFDHVRVVVAPAPYNEVARTSYRAD